MNDFLTEKNGEVKNYFESLGYEVTWDFNIRSGEEWWEILKDNNLIVQIDIHAPLYAIIQDFKAFYENPERTEGISDIDYKISGEDSSELRELFKKVALKEL